MKNKSNECLICGNLISSNPVIILIDVYSDTIDTKHNITALENIGYRIDKLLKNKEECYIRFCEDIPNELIIKTILMSKKEINDYILSVSNKENKTDMEKYKLAVCVFKKTYVGQIENCLNVYNRMDVK